MPQKNENHATARPTAFEVFSEAAGLRDMGQDRGSDPRQDRVRKRLLPLMELPKCLRATARILYYLLNEKSCFKGHASPEKIAEALNEGPKYFGELTARPLADFAERKTDIPEEARYLEYIRFVAILLDRNPLLRGDQYIADILDEFNIVDLYKAARDMDDEDFQAFYGKMEPKAEFTQTNMLDELLYRWLGLQKETQGDVQRRLLGKNYDAGMETFYTFRFSSETSKVSCSRLQLFRPNETLNAFHYRSFNSRAVLNDTAEPLSAVGLVFAFEFSIVLVASLSGGTGLSYMTIPRPIPEVGGAIKKMLGLVLTPDIRAGFGGSNPVASRIAFIRESSIPEEVRASIKLGLVPARDLSDALFDRDVDFFLGNGVHGSLKNAVALGGHDAHTIEDLSGLIEEQMKKSGASESWPFTLANSSGIKANPFAQLNFDSALGLPEAARGRH